MYFVINALKAIFELLIVQVELLFYFKNMYKCHKSYTLILVQVELLRLSCIYTYKEIKYDFNSLEKIA